MALVAGGYVAAIRAAQLGFKVACAEKWTTLGGTCLNVGCIPSKALLQSTEYFEWIKKSGKEHGISAADVAIDFDVLMQRKQGIVRGLVDGVASLFKKNDIQRLQGEASFVDPHTVEIANGKEKDRVHAKNIIVATGWSQLPCRFCPSMKSKWFHPPAR